MVTVNVSAVPAEKPTAAAPAPALASAAAPSRATPACALKTATAASSAARRSEPAVELGVAKAAKVTVFNVPRSPVVDSTLPPSVVRDGVPTAPLRVVWAAFKLTLCKPSNTSAEIEPAATTLRADAEAAAVACAATRVAAVLTVSALKPVLLLTPKAV